MKIKFNRLQWFVHIGSLLPFLILIFDYFTNNLTVNPIQEITQRTGRIAIIWLVLSLTCTPLVTVTGIKAFTQVRRPLGLYAAFYALLHYLTFSILDYGLNLQLITKTIIEKPFIILGSLGFLILLALSITSIKSLMRKMGKNWKRLHRSVYAAGVLIVIHYLLAVKAAGFLPIFLAVIMAILLILRLKPIRSWFIKRQPKWGSAINNFLTGRKPRKKISTQ